MAKAESKVQVIHPGSLLCLNRSHHPDIGPEGLEIGPTLPVSLPASLAQALADPKRRYGLVILGPEPAPVAPTPDPIKE